MMSAVRLTMGKSGLISLASQGNDGSRNFLWVIPDGGVITDESGDGRVRHRKFTRLDATGALVTVASTSPDTGPTSTYDAELRGELDGPWRPGVIDKVLPNGAHVHIERSGDASGHFWEKGVKDTVVDGEGWEYPGRTWVGTFHPYDDAQHPGNSNQRESSEWGTVTRLNGDKSSYSDLKVTTRDPETGQERTVTRVGENNPGTGEESRGIIIDNPDGTSSGTYSTTGPGGAWSIRTETWDRRTGDGTSHGSYGHGDTVEGESDTDIHKDPQPAQDRHDSTTQPPGDGEGSTEGNPDGPPFDSVRLRDLTGGAQGERDGLDTLGDLDARLRPFIDRIRAAAAVGGAGTSGEMLDSLGAPPNIFFDLTGVETDPTEELDSTGRPHPFFTTILDSSMIRDALAATGSDVTDVAAGAHVAVPIETMSELARRLTVTTSTVAPAAAITLTLARSAAVRR